MSLQIIRRDGTIHTLDCTVAYNQARDGAVTDHPIEKGADPSDHHQAKALSWDIRGLVSEGSRNELRPDEWHLMLESLMLSSEIITISHPRIGSFSNCVLVRYSFPLDKRRAIEFSLSVRQVRFARTTLVTIPASQPRTGAGDLADSSDGGKRNTEDADDTTDGRAKSSAAALYDLLTGR